MEDILLILEEASALGIRNETRQLAENLMVGYSNYLSNSGSGEAIRDHSKFYKLAFELLTNEDETEVETEPEVKPKKNDHGHESDIELIGAYEEYYNKMMNVAEEISVKDYHDNAKLIEAGETPFENVFIISDIWSLFMYYELIYQLELYDSPIMLLATEDLDLNKVPARSNVYVMSWHPTDHADSIVTNLIKSGHDLRDITKIETVGIQTMEPCQTIPFFNISDTDVWDLGFGLGKPNRAGKYSEYLSLNLEI